MSVWLFDSAGAALYEVAEFESIITTERFREHSEWSGRFPASAYTKFTEAYFAIVSGEPEVYLVEDITLKTDRDGQTVEVGGRSASALLHTRTIVGTLTWDTLTAGAMIADMMGDFTTTRALPLVFGTGDTVGSTFSLQRSWGDCGEIALEILAAQSLGMRTRMDGATVKLDVFAPNYTDTILGEAYGSADSSTYEKAKGSWRNYAYVLGEGVGDARMQVTVDQTASGERRELYVDASDLQKGVLTDPQYQALLSARGASKLADTRLVEWANADTDAALRAGDVVWYDSTRWAMSFMCTEAMTTYEGGTVKHTAKFGERRATLRKTLRRYAK